MINKADLLKDRQAYPMEKKVFISRNRIRAWHEHFGAYTYVSFSGGKDSTVLLHLVRSLFPKTPAVFVNTGLEFPEILEFVKNTENVIWLKPKMNFKKVLETYGFPIISKEVSQKILEARTTKSAKLLHKRLHGDDNKYKSGKIPNKWQYLIKGDFDISHKCCDVMKKQPMVNYQKSTQRYPYIGTMASDSHLRKQKYLRSQCNSFTGKIESTPLAFWQEPDIWEYIKSRKLDYCNIYDKGYNNTGCIFCCFGCHLEKPNKFQKMAETHPKLHDYCINKLGLKKVLETINVNYLPEHSDGKSKINGKSKTEIKPD